MNSQKKKILYVITKGNFGGAQRYVFDLATNLPPEHFEVVVAHGEGEVLPKKLHDAGIRTTKISGLGRNINPFKDIIAFFSLWKIIVKEKPKVVHLNSSKAGLLGGLIVCLINLLKTKNSKLRTIFTGHGWAFNEERPLWQKIFFAILHWKTILLCHETIAVSRRTADQVSRLPFVKRKIRIIYNGTEIFPLVSKEEAKKVLVKESLNRLVLGTIGELHKSKGHDLLINTLPELFQKYANVDLVIVGSGDREKELKKQVEELGLTERVHFSGFIPNARTYLQAFDIFVFPSRTEAFPYGPLEAGIAKLPVVASWAGGIPEIITNDENGFLIDPHNQVEITKALDDLIGDSNKRIDFGEALYQKVTSVFSIKQMVSQTSALY